MNKLPEWKLGFDGGEAVHKMNLERIFHDIFEIIDDIERININASDKEKVDGGLRYLDNIKKKALNLLAKQGVKPMVFKDNKAKFGWCEVVGTEKVNGLDDETIVREIKKGYLNDEKVLRLASVIIVNNKG